MPETGALQDGGDVHVVPGGVQIELDDDSTFTFQWGCPPAYHLACRSMALDAADEPPFHEPWQPLLHDPIAQTFVRLFTCPMDLLSDASPVVEVPMDAIFVTQSGRVLIISAREYDPGPPARTIAALSSILIVFGSGRATELGFAPA